MNGQKRFTRVEFPTTSKMPAFCSSVSVSYCVVGSGPCAIANSSETIMGREKTYREAFDLQSRSSALHSPPCTVSRGSACKTNHSTAQALGQELYDGLEERSQILQPEAAQQRILLHSNPLVRFSQHEFLLTRRFMKQTKASFNYVCQSTCRPAAS